MWRTSRTCLMAIAFVIAQGCKQQPAPSDESGKTPPASQPASASPQATGPASEAPEELSFEAQYALVLRGESIAIRLTQQEISVAQLQRLSELSEKLLELQLDAGVVDDRSIASLGPLASLEHLRLRASPLTDVGIARLDPSQLPKLRILNLPQSTLTASGLEHLAKIPNLAQLRLGAAQLDDRAAEVLATFPALRSLHLIGPKFTDAALESFARAPRLSSLYIDDCHLSDAAWERLFTAKPGIHVHIDQHHHDRDPSPKH